MFIRLNTFTEVEPRGSYEDGGVLCVQLHWLQAVETRDESTSWVTVNGTPCCVAHSVEEIWRLLKKSIHLVT